jgi:hypothetical protein
MPIKMRSPEKIRKDRMPARKRDQHLAGRGVKIVTERLTMPHSPRPHAGPISSASFEAARMRD